MKECLSPALFLAGLLAFQVASAQTPPPATDPGARADLKPASGALVADWKLSEVPAGADAPPGWRRLQQEGERLWGGAYEDPREAAVLPDGEPHEWAFPVPHDLAAAQDFVRSRLLGRPVAVGQVEDFVRYDLGGRPHRLSELLVDSAGQPVRVLALHWFAEWCSNCNAEAPFIVELHHRFGPRGLRIVGLGEYSHPAKLQEYVRLHNLPFLVLQGTPNAKDEDIRPITDYYRYRRSIGDGRKWGTPFTLFLENGNSRHVTAVAGEMRRIPVEAYLESVLPRL